MKNFPNEINHTIAWARDNFEGLFDQGPKNLKDYIKDPDKIKTMPAGDGINLVENLKFVLNNIPTTFEDCINTAYKYFHSQYRDQIVELLHKFPADYKTESGLPFWSGAKKCPKPIDFSVTNPNHLNYIISFSNIWANIFNIKNKDSEFVQEYVKALVPPKMYINDNAKISTTEEEEKKRLEELQNQDIGTLIKSLPDISKYKELNIILQEFEKDDDTNYHVEFMNACSNLRAINYSIKPVDKHTTKGIAGKIIPALATTTSVIAGLASLEIYKLIQKFDKIENYRNYFVNLALSYFGFSEPNKCAVSKIKVPHNSLEGFKEHTFTMWDTFIIKGNMTLKEFIDYFKNSYGFDLEFLTYKNFMIYSQIIPKFRLDKRMNIKLNEIIHEFLNEQVPKSINLNIGIDGENDSINLPDVLLTQE